jgi:hypothetical protein
MSLSPTAVPAVPLNIRMRNYRGKTIIGGYQHVMELSETASFVWRQIDGTRTIADIGAMLASEYEIDAETATTDVAELLAELAANDLVRL